MNIKEEHKRTTPEQSILYVIQYKHKDNLNWRADNMYEPSFDRNGSEMDLRYAKSLKSNYKYRIREYKLQEVLK